MNRSESKYFNTALRMDEALLALLEEKDLEYITVKEICHRAGVNRSTFYLHYETIADLVDEALEMINQRFRSYFPQQEEEILGNMGNRERENLVLVTGVPVTLPSIHPGQQKGLPGGIPEPKQHAGAYTVWGTEAADSWPHFGAV